jgi:peptidoglycan-associated lipoprotein
LQAQQFLEVPCCFSFMKKRTIMVKCNRWVFLGVCGLVGLTAGCASFDAMNDDAASTTVAPVTDGISGRDVGGDAVTQPLDTSSGVGFGDPLGDPNKPLDSTNALLNTRTFYFAFDESALHAEDYPVLRAHARYLNTHPQQRITIAGHTDERGSREYNIALGERRATAVQRFLEAEGVRADQLDTISYGEELPLFEGHTEADWAKNRRAVLFY